MSSSAIRLMSNKARLALKEETYSRINLHAYTGKKVERTMQAAVELAPDQDLIATTIKAHQCETCWDELHTDHLIYRFESMRHAKRGRMERKAASLAIKHCQEIMDWNDEESQAEAWLDIAVWDCLAENSQL